MKIKIMLIALAGATLLTGCSTPQQRIAECQATGVSLDACYIGEQTRQASINNASMAAAYANAHDAVNDSKEKKKHH
ncbi:TPA: hypothetical protein QCG56_000836 [Enterobacter cancerogenus]|jgi:hypothetical protein|uniref:hypothetical protein n=1 Tax=Enterobacter sp. TaxID=42895 RepID=UPI001F385BAC|nr:hypothetical protein [Enterobacter asburiae]HDR2159233.1 hypothetical protein [Enterobacter cancerogenus]HDR2164603.1 hypothetical protein [Enterobacter cancerogenus]HDR2266601.1 hypothetical protein [Enterobacter cancerogenus]